jgi:hypothetical protein
MKSLPTNTLLAVVFAAGMVCAIASFEHLRANRGEAGVRVWFYDQSAKKLYAAPRDLISPDGKDDRRVAAVVIGFQGLRNDPSELKIAYLEKYSPEFKDLLERAAAAHAAQRQFKEQIPSQASPYFQNNTFIKRPDETVWHPVGSLEARQIMFDWREWRGPNGEAPIISVPAMR